MYKEHIFKNYNMFLIKKNKTTAYLISIWFEQLKNKLVLTEKICKQGEVVETSKNKRQTYK